MKRKKEALIEKLLTFLRKKVKFVFFFFFCYFLYLLPLKRSKKAKEKKKTFKQKKKPKIQLYIYYSPIFFVCVCLQNLSKINKTKQKVNKRIIFVNKISFFVCHHLLFSKKTKIKN
jgi:hypothetical protein